MSQTTISGLPAASLPLTGAEQIPLDQNGVTSRVALSVLNVSGTITFSTQSNTGIGNPPFISTPGLAVTFLASELPGSGDVNDVSKIIGYVGFPQNLQEGNYIFTPQDTGRNVQLASGAGPGATFTIPANTDPNGQFLTVGTRIRVTNRSSNPMSIAINTDTLILSGSATVGTRTLAANGIAELNKVEPTVWEIINLGGLT